MYDRLFWLKLLRVLDYQDRKWYRCNDDGDWVLAGPGTVDRILAKHGVAEDDRERIKKLMEYRNQEAHRRSHDEVKQAQLRLGFA